MDMNMATLTFLASAALSAVFVPAPCGAEENPAVDEALVKFELSKGEKIVLRPDAVPTGMPYVVKNTKGGNVRLTNVTVPELAYFPAAGDRAKPAVIVCPGGGYAHLSYTTEGTAVAEWLNSIGCIAFVLKYTCPNDPDAALADIQQAIALVRARAGAFGVNPREIGVIGFSAGANLSARASTNWKKDRTMRPDFAILVYPWKLVHGDPSEKTLPLALRGEFPVDAETPPTLLVQAEDDWAHVENSLGYYAALKYSNVPAEMHVYPKGGHGFGLRKQGLSIDAWPDVAATWIRRLLPLR